MICIYLFDYPLNTPIIRATILRLVHPSSSRLHHDPKPGSNGAIAVPQEGPKQIPRDMTSWKPPTGPFIRCRVPQIEAPSVCSGPHLACPRTTFTLPLPMLL